MVLDILRRNRSECTGVRMGKGTTSSQHNRVSFFLCALVADNTGHRQRAPRIAPLRKPERASDVSARTGAPACSVFLLLLSPFLFVCLWRVGRCIVYSTAHALIQYSIHTRVPYSLASILDGGTNYYSLDRSSSVLHHSRSRSLTKMETLIAVHLYAEAHSSVRSAHVPLPTYLQQWSRMLRLQGDRFLGRLCRHRPANL